MARVLCRVRSFFASTAGFTNHELIVLGMLGAGTLAGVALRWARSGDGQAPPVPAFEYSALDSMFKALSASPPAGGRNLLSIPATSSPIDLNTADAADLTRLPGIGPALAGRIIHYRNLHGPFLTVDDLLRVRGIGPKKLLKLKSRVRVS